MVGIILIAIVTVVAVAAIFWLKRNGDASLRGDAGDARRRLPVVGAMLAVTLVALLLIAIIPRLSA